MEDIILEFGGIAYYIDFDGLENILKPDADLESGEIEESETKTTYTVSYTHLTLPTKRIV